jgi:hypothetical protein
MKKQNLWDEKAKAPDPDDLTSELPAARADAAREEPRTDRRPETRPNPDVSRPHVPPVDDE